MKIVWLWKRPGDAQDKLVSPGSKRRGPGLVYEMSAKNRRHAHQLLALFEEFTRVTKADVGPRRYGELEELSASVKLVADWNTEGL